MAYVRWSSSEWYIFWHVGFSKEQDESDRREDQLLAVWLAGHEDTPVLPYAEIKRLREADAWEEYFPEVPERDVLNRCVDRWLAEMEESYK